jgi:hypothetical protein
VAPFGEDEIEIAVAVQIGHAHVRRILGRGLEIDDRVERACRRCLLGSQCHGAHKDADAKDLRHVSGSAISSRSIYA